MSPGGSAGEAGAHPARVTASVTPSATVRGPFDPAYRLISVALVALITIIAFEAMAISTAMPSAARDLDAVRSYGLAFSVLLTAQLLGIVLAGVWVDRAGPLPSLFTGQVLLAGGSGLCAVSGSLAPFLLGRAVTGLGAGLIVVTGYVLVGRTYPDATRPRVFSMLSAAWVLPSLVGAPIAAWLTSTWSWRAVFGIVVVPVAATIAVVAARRAQIAGRQAGVGHASRDHRAHVRAAWAGALIAAAAGALQFGTHELEVRWSAKAVVALLGLVGVMVAAPLLVPRGTWRMAHGLPSVVLARSLMTAAFFGSITYLPLMLVGERGLSLAVAGIILSIGSLGWSAGSWLQGRDALNGRRERLVAAGGAALACGLLLLAATAWFALALLPLRPGPGRRRSGDGMRHGQHVRADPGADPLPGPRLGVLVAAARRRPRQRPRHCGRDGGVRGPAPLQRVGR